MFGMSPFIFFLTIGVVFIVTEILVFNLSLFWFLFVAIGAFITATVSWLLPEMGLLYASIVFVVTTTITSVLLYAPLRRWQQKPSAIPGNDAIGKSVTVTSDIVGKKKGQVNWSGATWDAKLADGSEPLSKGDTAVIEKINGIILFVKKS